jgi:hypothetical protein
MNLEMKRAKYYNRHPDANEIIWDRGTMNGYDIETGEYVEIQPEEYE